MCNRYLSPSGGDIERQWHVGRDDQWRGGGVFPRAPGAFIRRARHEVGYARELVVGQWGLIPWFAKTARLPYSTNNARAEEVAHKPSFKHPWARGQRCVVPALAFDEPCWETGKNVWWTFRRTDGKAWGLAGLWNTWVEPGSGELLESYTLLTLNADHHPLMGRMHKPDPTLPADRQDKRSVVVIEDHDVDAWLEGSLDSVLPLLRVPDVALFAGQHTGHNGP